MKILNFDSTIATVSAGTAAAPSISFANDPNTGIYSPGADQVAISTGGTGRLFVDASGNVGVATDSPAFGNFLAAIGAAGATGQHVSNTTASRAAVLRLSGGPQGEFYVGSAQAAYLWNRTNDSIIFGTNNTERLRITSAGLVGIGTSSPICKLHVGAGTITSGNLNAQATIQSDTTAAVGTSAATTLSIVQGSAGVSSAVGLIAGLNSGDPYFAIKTRAAAGGDSVERLRIDSSGRVGIGTTTVNRQLVLNDNGLACLALQNATTGNAATDGFQIQLSGTDAYVWNYENAPTIFGTNNTERARIDSSGRLLVGTASSSANARGLFQANPGSSSGNVFLCSSSNVPPDGASIGGLIYADSGHVAAATILGQRDAGTWTSGSSQPTRLVFNTTADGAASPTERLRITSAGVLQVADAGNIAVGTTTGTKIGTATTQKLGFFNATPVVQPAAVADATDAATVITQLNDLLAKLRTLGIIAT